MKRPMTSLAAIIAVAISSSGSSWLVADASAQEASITDAELSSEELLAQFQAPGNSAQPRTWWHWTKGNISLEGIDRDLEWMKRVGIGGFQIADVNAGGGQEVTNVSFGTPEWLQAVRHAAEKSRDLGLEMAIFSSPGWSLAGGPWVTPELAMKRLVWSETKVAGGKPYAAQLPLPPNQAGMVRDLRIERQSPEPFYRDSAVVAFRQPIAESDALPVVTSSWGAVDGSALLDDSLRTSVIVEPQPGNAAWIQLTYDRPFTARAVSIGNVSGIPVGRVQASTDGEEWSTLVSTPGPQGYHGAPIRTYSFPAVEARHFRVLLEGAPLTPAQVIDWSPVLPAKQFEITELKLFSDARVNRWEDKGAFGSLMNEYDGAPTDPAPSDAMIADSIVITDKMDADGTLRWTAPPGDWKVLRFGYANTGARNRPSVPAGSGLEVDKLNADYLARYLDGYFNPLRQELGPLFGTQLTHVMMDSWEAGMQNWTDEMIAEFQGRRGYDPTPYLPILTGRVMMSSEVSDRFLWDFRRTLADMYADNFYGAMADSLRERGLKSYAEASGVALEIPEDTIANKSKIDIPMAEFWMEPLHPFSEYYADVRGAASTGHALGKSIIAAEAFTGGWYEAPLALKTVADYWFAQGINRLVFHSTAHQPLDTKPGNTMVGTHINRNITWAELAKSFMDYVSRTSFMLQQGRFTADIAYLLPEGAPSTMPFWGAGLTPALPQGYDYDVINTDLLLRDMSVDDNGILHLKSGMQYRVLVLPPTDKMSVEVADRVLELVNDGAWIVGERPQHSTGLQNYPDSQAHVATIAESLWGGLDGRTNVQRQVGDGMVNWGLPLGDILRQADIQPDVEVSSSLQEGVVWLHRTLQDAEVYFVASQSDEPQTIEARFRVADKAPELWDPVTGETLTASYSMSDGRTTVPLDLAARQSLFVVFRKGTTAQTHSTPILKERPLVTLDGSWSLSFEPGPGAPTAPVTVTDLASWTTNVDPMVKFFSGTGIYTRTVSLTSAQIGEGAVLLDLGNVRDIAEVRVNGTTQGVVWTPPYRVDITEGLRPGENTIEIRVTNQWLNRIKGDEQLAEGQKFLPAAASIMDLFGAGKGELPASGLLGPVVLVSRER